MCYFEVYTYMKYLGVATQIDEYTCNSCRGLLCSTVNNNHMDRHDIRK